MKLSLKVDERLMLLGILPETGDLLTLKIVRQLRDSCLFTEQEIKDLEIRVEGSTYRWDITKDGTGKEIYFGELGYDLVRKVLKDLNDQKKLMFVHLPLCELFNIT